MTFILKLFILIPFAGLVVSLLLPEKNERLISGVSRIILAIHFIGAQIFLLFWGIDGFKILNIKDIVLFKAPNFEFFLDFYFDRVSAVFLLVGSFLTFLVAVYSKNYLHRESGYKRFFTTILLFYVGYNLTIFSGNMETLFIGWEFLGISSFLLIAFYRERYLPVKNAVKVFSVYRLGDIGIILAMWMSHHLWHENVTFLKLQNAELVHEHLQSHTWIGIFISFMILVSAAAKSAQLPFSSWLPRAMEGPTPSSAIFYGSLSVNMGVFLLLKTMAFWEHQVSVRIMIAMVGITTSIVATIIARVQSSVKSQIAYASLSQIGLIFVEVAAGLELLALIHFAGNAFLRTYQILVSPSVVSYLIKEQAYNFELGKIDFPKFIPPKIKNTIYMLGIKEWNLDNLIYNLYWHPLKIAGKKLSFITLERVLIFFIPVYTFGLLILFYESKLGGTLHQLLPLKFTFIGLIMVLKSFSERKRVESGWTFIIMNHFWVTLGIAFNEHLKLEQALLYLSGILISGAVGLYVLKKLKTSERNINIDRFRGHSYEHPTLAFIFLLACLGLSGFPITPSFIGEDVIFSHIHEDQILLAFFVSLCFILNGLSIIRIYARLFMGPHVKTYHELAYKSS